MGAPTNVLLSGVVGSTAYGLAGPDSDIDRLGIYACDTRELLGLGHPKETHHTTHPDVTIHEAGKWCRLALGGNPTVMELVWLDDYETVTYLGEELVAIRTAFLSARRVRDAYLGYATQQLKKLETASRFPDVPVSRIEKYGRHLRRLLHQGLTLYTEGYLTIRLTDPDLYWRFGKRCADGDIQHAKGVLAEVERAFRANERSTPLPEHPDYEAVEAWLQRVRRAHLEDK